MTAFFRFVLFLVFFSSGAAAVWVSIAIDDLVQYYTIIEQKEKTEQSIIKVKVLIEDHKQIIKQIETEPNITKRLAIVTFGIEPNSPDTAYPKVEYQEQAVARRVLEEMNQKEPDESIIPGWLDRTREPVSRIILFFAGLGLTLVSFVYFGHPNISFKGKNKKV